MAFKTKAVDWLDTDKSVVILVSVHSSFHEGLVGELKMEALCNVIKNHVKGKVTLLFTEKAHLHAMELKYNSKAIAFEKCLQDARHLLDRFKKYFTDFNIAFWHSYIGEEPYYKKSCERIYRAYQEDPLFQEHLKNDAEKTYTEQRAFEFPDKALFIQKTIEDILEQCACLLVLSHKGYRFQFYPGNCYTAYEHVNTMLLSKDDRVSFIHVFLTIEQKNIQAI